MRLACILNLLIGFNELGRHKSVNAWSYCRCQTVRDGIITQFQESVAPCD